MPSRRAATKPAAVKQEPEAKESPLPSPPPDSSASTVSPDAAEVDDEDEATLPGSQAEVSDEEEDEDEVSEGAGSDSQADPKESQKRQRVAGYNALKTFNGQTYSGMAVGGAHKWNYEPGLWTEAKMEPDLWKVDYHTSKRRLRNAPKNSGAPVGTEYHWLIVAHQVSCDDR